MNTHVSKFLFYLFLLKIWTKNNQNFHIVNLKYIVLQHQNYVKLRGSSKRRKLGRFFLDIFIRFPNVNAFNTLR
jgi:hypothetical protein